MKHERGERPKRPKRLRRGQRYPDFDSLFDGNDETDPFADIEYTGDVEIDAQVEMSEALRSIIAERKGRAEEWRILTDTEFWVAVCFQSRAQKDEFLEKAGLLDLGDKYLNGLVVAERMGVDVEPIILNKRPPNKPPRGLREDKLYIKGGDS